MGLAQYYPNRVTTMPELADSLLWLTSAGGDLGDAASAYRFVREAAPPGNPYYRAEYHFRLAGSRLRFLNDPSTALEHFARIDEGSTDPIVRARAAYWRGRAAEVAGRFEEMRAQYEAAARYPTAY